MNKRPLSKISLILSLCLFSLLGNKDNIRKAMGSSEPVFKVKMIDMEGDGDCTLITCGDTQILIDCGGSSKTSITNILNAVGEVFPDDSEDKTLDYVIFSHGDSDHIFSFACDAYDNYDSKFNVDPLIKDSSCLACFLRKKGIGVGTFIDFDYSQDKSLAGVVKDGLFTKESDDETEESKGSSGKFARYKNARDYLKKNKKIENYFTASQCLYSKRKNVSKEELGLWEGNTKTPTQEFSFDTKGELKILDNIYCYSPYTGKDGKKLSVTAVDKNLLSVCCLIKYDGYNYLFTGDLPEFESSGSKNRVGGESKLVENNYDDLKGGVLYFKAAHHGSETANSDNLLNVIKPQYVGASCFAGARRWFFPKDTVFENFGYYTDRIYITGCNTPDDDSDADAVRQKYHGTTLFKYSPSADLDEKLVVTSENGKRSGQSSITQDLYSAETSIWKLADDKKSKGKATNNRRFPIRVIGLSSWGLGAIPNDCTYVKMGHYDVLINDGQIAGEGAESANKDDYLTIEQKIESLCNDHVLDCLVISSLFDDSCSRIVKLLSNVGNTKPLKKIKNVIINPLSKSNVRESDSTKALVQTLHLLREGGCIGKIIGLNPKGELSDHINDETINLDDTTNNYVKILHSDLNQSSSENSYENSLAVNVHFGVAGEKFNYINFGCLDVLSEIDRIIGDFKDGINALTIPFHGDLINDCEFNPSWPANKAKNSFGALFNGPFGKINKDGVNLYPTNLFRYMSLLKEGTYNFFANKKMALAKSTTLSPNSLIDLALTFRYPYFAKESVRANQFFYSAIGENHYFSNKNVMGDNFSEYADAKISFDAKLRDLLF